MQLNGRSTKTLLGNDRKPSGSLQGSNHMTSLLKKREREREREKDFVQLKRNAVS
jgi:hypothetical protein